MDFYEFKASLVYRASFTIARVTQKNSFSKKKKKKKKSKGRKYSEQQTCNFIHIGLKQTGPMKRGIVKSLSTTERERWRCF